jgi:predicted nucleic acid-binding protein
MESNASEITSYPFSQADELLLDTNIWFLVFGPHKPGDKRTQIYSRALANIMAAQSRIYIDAIVVSEFVNAYARLKHKIRTSSRGVSIEFKQFRQTPDFVPIAQAIAADTRRILGCCSRIESEFSTISVDSVLDEFEKGGADLNDLLVAELCKKNGLKLITDDGDFKITGLSVLTANKKLLTQ